MLSQEVFICNQSGICGPSRRRNECIPLPRRADGSIIRPRALGDTAPDIDRKNRPWGVLGALGLLLLGGAALIYRDAKRRGE